MVKHISSPKGKDNPFQRQRVCFKHTHLFFRQWKSTFVDGDPGAMLLCQSDALAASNCSWRLSMSTTKFTRWREKNTNTAGFPLWLGKGQNKGVHWHPSWRWLSFLLLVFTLLLFLLLLLFQSVVSHGKNHIFISGPIKNMCNIHTISPLNCTQKIKRLFWKWKFRKVQIKKDVKEWWQKRSLLKMTFLENKEASVGGKAIATKKGG